MRNECTVVYGFTSIVSDKFVDLYTNMGTVTFKLHLVGLFTSKKASFSVYYDRRYISFGKYSLLLKDP